MSQEYLRWTSEKVHLVVCCTVQTAPSKHSKSQVQTNQDSTGFNDVIFYYIWDPKESLE